MELSMRIMTAAAVAVFFIASFLTLALALDDSDWEISAHAADNESGLIFYMPFERDYTDESSSANHGSPVSDPKLNVSGAVGQTGQFNYTGGGYVRMANPLSPTGNNFSVTLWIKSFESDPADERCFVSSYDGDSYIRFGTSNTDNRLTFFAGNARAGYRDNLDYDNGEWQHLAYTYDNSTDTITFYMNGTSVDFGYYNPGDTSSQGFTVGEIHYSEGLNFDGLIDEVRVYDRVLTASEILEQYNSSRNNASVNFGYQPSVRINGTGGSGNLSYDITWYLNGTINRTTGNASDPNLVAWYPFDNNNSWDYSYAHDGSMVGNANLNQTFAKLGGGSMRFEGGGYVQATITETKESIALWYRNLTGDWTFVVNASGTWYVNGAADTPEFFPVYISGNTVQIGKTASDVHNGFIDEVRIYNDTLSDAEIQRMYDAGLYGGLTVPRSQTSPCQSWTVNIAAVDYTGRHAENNDTISIIGVCPVIIPSVPTVSPKNLTVSISLNNTNNMVYVASSGVGPTNSSELGSGTEYSSLTYGYAASYSAQSALVGIVGYDAIFVNVSNTTGAHTMEMNQNITERFLLAVTFGDWETVENRMPSIERRDFLQEISPSFSYGIGMLYSIKMIVNCSGIDIQNNLILNPGRHRMLLDYNETDSSYRPIMRITTI